MFIDTNIFVAALNEKDSDHERGKVLLEAAFNRLKWLYTSDYILDECFSVVWSKTRKQPRSFRFSLIRRLDEAIEESEKVRLLKVEERDFATAKSFLRKHTGIIPTLTDWTSLVLMKRHGISGILSLDRHFKSAKRIAEFSHIQVVKEVSGILPSLKDLAGADKGIVITSLKGKKYQSLHPGFNFKEEDHEASRYFFGQARRTRTRKTK